MILNMLKRLLKRQNDLDEESSSDSPSFSQKQLSAPPNELFDEWGAYPNYDPHYLLNRTTETPTSPNQSNAQRDIATKSNVKLKRLMQNSQRTPFPSFQPQNPIANRQRPIKYPIATSQQRPFDYPTLNPHSMGRQVLPPISLQNRTHLVPPPYHYSIPLQFPTRYPNANKPFLFSQTRPAPNRQKFWY